MKKTNPYIIFCFLCLTLFLFGNECRGQYTFNTYSIIDIDSTKDVSFHSRMTHILLTPTEVRVDSDEYNFSDVVIDTKPTATFTTEYYTQSGDIFIKNGNETFVYTIKMIPHYGGVINFFNVNQKQ